MPNIQFWARESSGVGQLDSSSVRRLLERGLNHTGTKEFESFVDKHQIWGFVECHKVAADPLPIYLCVGYEPKTEEKRRAIVIIDEFHDSKLVEEAIKFAGDNWQYPKLVYRPVSGAYSIEIDDKIYPILSMCYKSYGD